MRSRGTIKERTNYRDLYMSGQDSECVEYFYLNTFYKPDFIKKNKAMPPLVLPQLGERGAEIGT